MADERQVSRKVFFYRIEHFSDLKADLPQALRHIDTLSFHDQGRYQQDISENVLLSVYPDSFEYPIRIRFGRTRRDMLPDVEKDGVLRTLSLDDNAGLIDVGHIMIFEDGHAAVESSRDAPNIKKLGDYLFLKGKSLSTSPTFLPLFERDIVQVLEELDRVRLIELDVPPDMEELIRIADNNLADAIKAAERAGSTEKVVLDLVGNVSSEGRLKALARNLAEFVKGHPTEKARFNKLRVSGFSDGIRPRKFVDILEERLVSGEIFARRSEKSRSIDSDDAFRVIERAYNLRKDRLSSAAAGSDIWP